MSAATAQAFARGRRRVAAQQGRTLDDELLSSLIHGGAGIAALAGVLVLLLSTARSDATPMAMAAIPLYAVTLLAVFQISALYHLVLATRRAGEASHTPRCRASAGTCGGRSGIPSSRFVSWLQRLDHSGVMLYLGGGATPILVRDGSLEAIGLVWLLVLLSVARELAIGESASRLRLVLPVGLTLLVVGLVVPEVASWGDTPLRLLTASLVCFAVGFVLYVTRSVPFHHSAWHACVTAGAAFHYALVLLHGVPRT